MPRRFPWDLRRPPIAERIRTVPDANPMLDVLGIGQVDPSHMPERQEENRRERRERAELIGVEAELRILTDRLDGYTFYYTGTNFGGTATAHTTNAAYEYNMIRVQQREYERELERRANMARREATAAPDDTVLELMSVAGSDIAINDRMDNPAAFLRWYWHYGHQFVARYLDTVAITEEARALQQYVSAAANHYGLGSGFDWKNYTNLPNHHNGTLMRFVLDHPSLFAYLREYYRSYKEMIRLQTGRSANIPSHWMSRGLLSYRKELATMLAAHNLKPAPWACLSPSAADESKIEFFQSEDKFIRDIRTTSTIGKSLPLIVTPQERKAAMAPATWDALVRTASDTHRDHYVAEDIVFLTKEEDIIAAYLANGTSSCMTKRADIFQGPKHPLAFYADMPGVALAVLRRGAATRARAFTYVNPDNPEDKRWIRIYGDTIMAAKLQRAGFSQGTWRNVKLRKIPATLLDGTIIPETYVCPYLDDVVGMGLFNVIYTDDEKDYFIVTDADTARQWQAKTSAKLHPQVWSGRSQSGLTGKYHGYQRADDRRWGYEVRGISYHAPDSTTFNQDHDICCFGCNTVFNNPTNDPSPIGHMIAPEPYFGFSRSAFICHACFGVHFVEAIYDLFVRDGPDDAVGRFTRARFPVAAAGAAQLWDGNQDYERHPSRRTFYPTRNTDSMTNDNLVLLSESYYPPPRYVYGPDGLHVRYAGWVARDEDVVRLPGGYNVLRADTVVSLTGRTVHRSSCLTMSIRRTDEGETRTFMLNTEINNMMVRDRLRIVNNELIVVKPSADSADEAVFKALHGMDDEDDPDIDTSAELSLADTISIIYSHVQFRAAGSSNTRLRDLTKHQLQRILENTPEETCDEIVRIWSAKVLEGADDGHLLAQRFQRIQAAVLQLPPAKDTDEGSFADDILSAQPASSGRTDSSSPFVITNSTVFVDYSAAPGRIRG